MGILLFKLCTYTKPINRKGQKLYQTSLEIQSGLGPPSSGGSGVLSRVRVPSVGPFVSLSEPCSGWGGAQEALGSTGNPAEGAPGIQLLSRPRSAAFLTVETTANLFGSITEFFCVYVLRWRPIIWSSIVFELLALKKISDNQIWCGCRYWLMLLSAGRSWGD